jgi:hypothetical protein
VGAPTSKINQVDCSAPKKGRKNSHGKQAARKQLFSSKGRKRRAMYPLSDSSTEDEEPIVVSTDEEDSADEECAYCNGAFSCDTSREKWIRCVKCCRWVHELRAGVEKHGWKSYVCEFCSPD